ncbi:hypothetical protein PR202_ga29899 [Eleusine coracana subsp. coracana]|uniref:Pentatricopeptide repeat-containing protein n=1 Tax=Eleusine coracana subsp. coracana TaxID=191504 RepID=A0AAV5DMW2_ELECO|nr:hypothetical protein PR202_ga29899 [Eleusine coracana subsp. coracana]
MSTPPRHLLSPSVEVPQDTRPAMECKPLGRCGSAVSGQPHCLQPEDISFEEWWVKTDTGTLKRYQLADNLGSLDAMEAAELWGVQWSNSQCPAAAFCHRGGGAPMVSCWSTRACKATCDSGGDCLRGLIIYSTIINELCKTGDENKAFELWKEMVYKGLKSDVV